MTVTLKNHFGGKITASKSTLNSIAADFYHLADFEESKTDAGYDNKVIAAMYREDASAIYDALAATGYYKKEA